MVRGSTSVDRRCCDEQHHLQLVSWLSPFGVNEREPKKRVALLRELRERSVLVRIEHVVSCHEDPNWVKNMLNADRPLNRIRLDRVATLQALSGHACKTH